ncbi:MAG: carbohydrate kinase [Balneola sp.]|nr:MAG: carbohydrate kinase [Balneola sp.]
MSSAKVICYGEVLWDALPKGIYLGGSPLNVALNLSYLGIDSSIISATGTDLLGNLAVKSISKKGLKTELIQRNEYPTGLVEVDIDTNGIPEYLIHENVAWDHIKLNETMANALSESAYLMFGTLAFRGRSGSTLRELLKTYKGKVVLDVNLRAPFYNEDLVDEALSLANVLKLNEDELAQILTWKNRNDDYESALHWLSDQYELETILLSLGGKGAYILKDGAIAKKGRYYVKVRDTVGAGDAFLAGAIHGLLNGKNAFDTICFANAVGAFVASRNGATPVLNMSKIEIYLKYGK